MINSYIPREEWVAKDGMKLEKEAEKAVRFEGNASVLAGPGAGKTELLAQKACFLLETNTCPYPKKILAISFKRDSAKTLKERVERRCAKEFSDRFVSLTYDSFAKQLLDRFNHGIPIKYRPSKDYQIQTFYFNDVKRFQAEVEKLYDFHEYLDYRGFSVSHADILLPIDESKLETSDDWYTKYLWRLFINNGRNSRLTFPMITNLIIYLFKTNPLLLKALQSTYSHVFLDEFQDTTIIQYELVKTLFQESEVAVTAVGDIKQRIMGWAGAIENALSIYETDFSAIRFELIVNHRSVPRLVEIQSSIVKNITGLKHKTKPSEKWKDKNEGFCEIWIFENQHSEAIEIADKIEEWLEEDDINNRDVCVLVRQNAEEYSGELINELQKRNIHARNEELWQNLLSENFMPYVIDIFTLSLVDRDAEAWMRLLNNLTSLYGKSEDADHNLDYEVSDFLSTFRLYLQTTDGTTKENMEELLWEILHFIDLRLLQDKHQEYKNFHYLNQKVKQIAEFLCCSYNRQRGDWKKTLKDFLGEYSIPIMTIHKSKGLEFKHVILLGLEDGAFWNFENNAEEEILTFFVGLSRATHSIIFTFCSERFQIEQRNNIKILYEMLYHAGVKEKNKDRSYLDKD